MVFSSWTFNFTNSQKCHHQSCVGTEHVWGKACIFWVLPPINCCCFCQRIINLCGNQELHFWGQGYPSVVIQIYATQMKLLCYWRVEIWESGFGMYKWKRCFSRKCMCGCICILTPRQKYSIFLWMDISVKIQLEFQFPTDQNNNEVHCPTSRGEWDFLQQTWWAHWKWDCQHG